MTGRKAGDRLQDYLTITLTNVLIASYQQSGAGGAEVVPMEQVSLNDAKIEIEYREQRPDGTLGSPVTGGFDVKGGKVG